MDMTTMKFDLASLEAPPAVAVLDRVAGGFKAFQALRAAGVTMYTTTAATASEALALYREGKLTEATGADAPRGRRR